MSKILVVGSSNLDFVWRCPRLPERGETVAGGSFATYAGGKGANQAVAAGRLGADAALCACVGNDIFGEQMKSSIGQAGVDVRFVRTGGSPSGTACIAVQDDGSNQIVVAPGANMELTAHDVRQAADALNPKIALAQCEISMEAIEAASTAAPIFLLNPAPAAPLPAEVIARCFALIPNETELRLLASASDQDQAAAELLAKGAKNVIVTLGAEGVDWYSQAEGRLRFPAHQVEAVDTVAAGDVFCGALAASLAAGQGMRDAIAYASAAAAVSVTRHGAQASCPTHAQVMDLMSGSGNSLSS